MRYVIVSALVLASIVAAKGARAEDRFWARRSDAMVERAHRVRLEMAPGYAKLVVRRTVFNGGERNDEANFDIFVPDGAVAVGLRTLALVDGKPHWYPGELLEAEEAAAKYLELTGIGGAYPKDPALLSWRRQGHLRLQVFPCPPRAPKSVEYTLLLPTRYEGGAHRLTLASLGTEDIPPHITLRTRVPGGKLTVGGAPYRGQALDGSAGLEVALAVPRAPVVGGALATVDAGGAAVSHIRVEAAPILSTVPPRARIALVFDVSHSLGSAAIEASVAAARGYLSHFGADARVEIIDFDRAVRRRYDRLVPARRAFADLKGQSYSPRNGSEVDEALRLADRVVSGAGGPGRIVLFTDALTRQSLTAARLRAVLGGEALVHIVHPMAGSASLIRDDGHAWSEVARSTGGLVWSAQADGAGGDDVFEELARPTRIDHLALAFEHDPPFVDVPRQLAEGEGFAHLEVAPTTQGWANLAGELWATPVRARFRPAPAESTRWAALVFGQFDHTQLSEDQMMVLAHRGGAVSPVTSYLAIEPGVRPSRDGLARVGRGLRGRAPRVRMGGTTASGTPTRFDGQAYLTHALASLWLTCGGAGKRATVELETTLAEVVALGKVTSEQGGAAKVACLREAAWGLALPNGYDEPWASWRIRI